MASESKEQSIRAQCGHMQMVVASQEELARMSVVACARCSGKSSDDYEGADGSNIGIALPLVIIHGHTHKRGRSAG